MNVTDTTTAVLAMLEEATLADAGSLAADGPLLGMEGWDSMGMVMFIHLVQERFGFELSIADLRDCETAAELSAAIHARLEGGK